MPDTLPKISDLPGIKEAELVKLGACAMCRKPLLSEGITFYAVSIRRACFDRQAIERRVGLQMMLGSAALAQAMGPNDDIAKVFDQCSVVVHEDCAARVGHLLQLFPQSEPEADDNAA